MDAIQWLSLAYNNVPPSCVPNCFRKAGFPVASNRERDYEEADLLRHLPGFENGDVMPSDYVSIDEHACTEDEVNTLDALIGSAIEHDDMIELSSDEEDAYEEAVAPKQLTVAEAMHHMSAIKQFEMDTNNAALVENIYKTCALVQAQIKRGCGKKQYVMNDFFNKQ